MTKESEYPYALNFRKGGKLIFNEWVYDEAKEEGEYVERDITTNWFHKRDKPCSVDPDVTLNDVLLFISREPEICDLIFVNCFAKEYIESWKKIYHQTRPLKHTEYDPDGIEYLELYWAPEINFHAAEYDEEITIEGTDRACCHGVGWVLKEDKFEHHCDDPTWKAGSRINWGIDFMPMEQLLDIPIKLNETFDVRDDWQKYNNTGDTATRTFVHPPSLICVKKSFSFEQIVHGLLWEISFCGTEEDKLTKKNELDMIVNDLDLKENSDD